MSLPRPQACNSNGECDECNPTTPCNCNPGFVAPFCTQSAVALRQCFSSGTGRTCVECIGTYDDYLTRCSSCFGSSNILYTKITDGAPMDLEGGRGHHTHLHILTLWSHQVHRTTLQLIVPSPRPIPFVPIHILWP